MLVVAAEPASFSGTLGRRAGDPDTLLFGPTTDETPLAQSLLRFAREPEPAEPTVDDCGLLSLRQSLTGPQW